MSPSSRRRVSVAVLSTGLLAGALVPLTGASAASCASWTDKKGDATTNQSGQAVLADANLDIVAAALGTVGDSLVATITTDGLSANSSDAGDEFFMLFSVGAVEMTMYADRFTVGGVTVRSAAGILDNQSGTPIKTGEATYDVKTKTVTIKVKTTDVVEASGGKVPVGSTLTKLSAGTANVVPIVFEPVTRYDDAPTPLTPVFGTACDLGGAPSAAAPAASGPAASASPAGSASPAASASPSSTARPSGSPSASGSASPSASPSASATPTGSPGPAQPTVPVPAPGCFGFVDPKGDARPGNASAPNEPDLDIVAVTGRTESTAVAGHLQIDRLGARPGTAIYSGHRFDYQFTLGGKVVVLRASATGAGAGLVDGVAAPGLKVTAAFDTVSSQVVLSVDRASLAKVLGREISDGTFLEAQTGRSTAVTPLLLFGADTATSDDMTRARYTVGDNTCFAPRLSVSLPAEVQTSDIALVNVSMTTSDGRTAADQTVTARVGDGRAVRGQTDDKGDVTLRVPVSEAAGTRLLTVRTTGSAGQGELTSDTRVLVERALLSAGVRGTGAVRTVTATLVDDDRRPLTRQRVTFSFGRRSVTATTDRAGRATVTVPQGSVVEVAFAGRAGFLTATRMRLTAR